MRPCWRQSSDFLTHQHDIRPCVRVARVDLRYNLKQTHSSNMSSKREIGNDHLPCIGKGPCSRPITWQSQCVPAPLAPSFDPAGSGLPSSLLVVSAIPRCASSRVLLSPVSLECVFCIKSGPLRSEVRAGVQEVGLQDLGCKSPIQE